MNRLRDIVLQAVSSLWFHPAWITIAMGLAASFAIWLDLLVDRHMDGMTLAQRYPYIFGAGRESATSMLSTMAGALVTAAGVSLSGVLVALSIASSQYTSRILRTLTGDRTNQITLGVILGAFVYSLVVLKSVGTGESREFVPELAVLSAVPVGLAGISSLVFFVHNVSRYIQAGSILERIAQETFGSIEVAFPGAVIESAADSGTQEGGPDGGETFESPIEIDLGESPNWKSLRAAQSGYVRTVNASGLVAFAVEHDALIRMDKPVGTFVHSGESLLSIALVTVGGSEEVGTDSSGLTGAGRAQLLACYRIGSFRTAEQDAAFGLRQMVDIALKALSPGVNDTTTAVMAVHRLSSALRIVAERKEPGSRHFEGGKLRLISLNQDLRSLLYLSFEEIVRAARSHPACLLALVEGWIAIAEVATAEPERRPAVESLAAFLAEAVPVVREALQDGPRWGSAGPISDGLDRVSSIVKAGLRRPG